MHLSRTWLYGAGLITGVALSLILGAIGPHGSGDPSGLTLDEPSPIATGSVNSAVPDPGAEPRTVRVKQTDGEALRVIAFGAHPDDCEIQAGGSAILWNRIGAEVQFVSITNGDIGHWQMAGGPLAKRRYAEVQEAAEILGTTTTVLDIHDGELLPTLENRRILTRLIRNWNADIVMTHRPNDYHPDHRYTGILVQDSAYMVAVPFFCPDTPPLGKNPVYLYYYDRFQEPSPFDPDVVVAIDAVVEAKLDALGVMESQFYEGGALGGPELVPDPSDPGAVEKRKQQVRQRFSSRFASIADQYRDKLIELYGETRGRAIRYAEAFQVCEYGAQPTREQLLALFPFIDRSE